MEKLSESLQLLASLNNVQKYAQSLTSSYENVEYSSAEFERLQSIDLAVSECVGNLVDNWQLNGLITSDEFQTYLDLIVKV